MSKPNQTFRPATQIDNMRSYKLIALHNFDEWECQTCGTDLWLVPHEVGDEWALNFCSAECAQQLPLSDEIAGAFKRVIEAGDYHVDAFDVADAMLDGKPKRNATSLRSRQWRERRLEQLQAMYKPTIMEVALAAAND